MSDQLDKIVDARPPRASSFRPYPRSIWRYLLWERSRGRVGSLTPTLIRRLRPRPSPSADRNPN